MQPKRRQEAELKDQKPFPEGDNVTYLISQLKKAFKFPEILEVLFFVVVAVSLCY